MNDVKQKSAKVLFEAKQLVDAHRHGSHNDLRRLDLRGKPVLEWSALESFIKFEDKNSHLTREQIRANIIDWNTRFDCGLISQVIDWGGKCNRLAVAQAYASIGIRSLSTIYWSQQALDNDPPTIMRILPDERHINDACANAAKIALNNGEWITLHAMQSPDFCHIGKERLGMSIIKWLHKHNLLSSHTLLVHLNFASDDDIDMIKEANCRVVICPCTAISLGNPIPPSLLDLDFNLGTDAVTVTGTGSVIDNAIALYEYFLNDMDKNLLFYKINNALKRCF